MKVNMEQAVQAGASLFDPDDSIVLGIEAPLSSEYLRGMSEAIARMFPEPGVTTSEKAEKVAQAILRRVS